MSVTVYGASDDLVEVEGDIREEFNALGNLDQEDDGGGGYLAFDDGNVLKIVYTADGVWRITPVALGKGEVTIKQAVSSDDDYSDRATIDGQLRWVSFGSAVAVSRAHKK